MPRGQRTTTRDRIARAPRALLPLLALASVVAATPVGHAPPPRGAVTDHVIIVSLDGLRPDAIELFGAERIQALMRAGSYSLEARTILPSKTLPSHTSMLTGVTPEVHGVTWNSDQTDVHGVVDVPTIFELAHDRGLTTAAFFSKSKFHHLVRPGSLDYVQAPSSIAMLMATRTVADAIRYLRHARPNLLFVHVGEADYAGHTTGWMSRIYGIAVARADAAVGSLVQAAEQAYGEGQFTVIITADHGGHGRDHGTEHDLDMTIPWIVYGEGVERGAKLEDLRTMDTAATALWLLGVQVPASWTGRPVEAAFTPLARYVASLYQASAPTTDALAVP
ncbi:MAG: alkaline phosphatase family protein [Longimicrobiales bacterium]